jgi:hypothetical protein
MATFVNKGEVYLEMKQSFEAAGFDAPDVVYEVLDDRIEDPYSAITRLGQASEQYIVLLHQDVRCDQGHRYNDLLCALEALESTEPRWAVAGNAGGLAEDGLLRHICDPWGAHWAPDLPRRVVTLDENFLVLRTERRPRCSASLSGFHLYGTDVCLHALSAGDQCYVVDFRVSHLSLGDGSGLREAEDRLGAQWGRRSLVPYYVQTPTMVIPIARWRGIRLLLARPRVGMCLSPRLTLARGKRIIRRAT